MSGCTSKRLVNTIQRAQGRTETYGRHGQANYSGFRLIGSPVNWGSRLFGANLGEQNQIENITRICSLIWGTMPFNWAGNCYNENERREDAIVEQIAAKLHNTSEYQETDEDDTT
jgi:hypothetical protein